MYHSLFNTYFASSVKIVIFPCIFYKSVNSNDRHLAVEQQTKLTLDRIVTKIIRFYLCWFCLVVAFDHGTKTHYRSIYYTEFCSSGKILR